MTASTQAAGAVTRLSDDALWDKHVKSGTTLVSNMERGPYGQSGWTYEDLRKQGWKQEDWNDKPFLSGPNPRVHLAATLKELMVSDKDRMQGGLNNYQVLKLDRKQMTKELRDLVQSIPNHGNFENSFNPEDGVLICHLNFQPKTQVYAGPQLGVVPLPRHEPKHWSDLIFLQWEHFARQEKYDVRNLRYVFRSRIANDQTQRVIERAVIRARTNISSMPQASVSSSPGIWPGLAFATDSEEGKALLATPNAAGIARGMIDRPKIYHDMVVRAIQVFVDEPPENTIPKVCMLIHIVDKLKQQTPQAPESSQQKVEATGKDPSKVGKVMKSAKGKVKEGYQEGCKNQ